MEATLSPVFKRLRRHIGHRKLTVLLGLAKKTFSTLRICILSLLTKLLSRALAFVSQLKLSFSDACQIACRAGPGSPKDD